MPGRAVDNVVDVAADVGEGGADEIANKSTCHSLTAVLDFRSER